MSTALKSSNVAELDSRPVGALKLQTSNKYVLELGPWCLEVGAWRLVLGVFIPRMLFNARTSTMPALTLTD
jgi:hypothetical protein